MPSYQAEEIIDALLRVIDDIGGNTDYGECEYSEYDPCTSFEEACAFCTLMNLRGHIIPNWRKELHAEAQAAQQTLAESNKPLPYQYDRIVRRARAGLYVSELDRYELRLAERAEREGWLRSEIGSWSGEKFFWPSDKAKVRL